MTDAKAEAEAEAEAEEAEEEAEKREAAVEAKAGVAKAGVAGMISGITPSACAMIVGRQIMTSMKNT